MKTLTPPGTPPGTPTDTESPGNIPCCEVTYYPSHSPPSTTLRIYTRFNDMHIDLGAIKLLKEVVTGPVTPPQSDDEPASPGSDLSDPPSPSSTGSQEMSCNYTHMILILTTLQYIMCMGVRSLRKGGGDLNREVGHNKCFRYKNNKKM